jgi:hypothetical protein
MNYTKNFEPKTFELGAIAKTFLNVLKNMNIDPNQVTFQLFSNYGTIQSDKVLTIDELGLIQLDLKDYSISCYPILFHRKEILFRLISLSYYEDSVSIDISSKTIDNLRTIEKILIDDLSLVELIESDLEDFSGAEDESLESKYKRLEERINLIEQNLERRNANLSCFIALRFDDKSKSYLQILEKFLTLLDIKVSTGLPYEPRSVSEKVLSKLEQIDFVISIITASSESIWTRDELLLGSQNGSHPIPLIEKGSKFTGGIFADLEFIEFEVNCIESAFIKLLEGIRYIEKYKELNRSTLQSSPSKPKND